MSVPGLAERIWQRDVTLWGDSDTPELADRLGWLDLPVAMSGRVDELTALADEVRGAFDRVILCGMGGSSLAAHVLWRTFGKREGYPSLHVLDTTHPDAISAVLPSSVPPVSSDLFVIASKSGTTIETTSLYRLFWERTGGAGDRFIAITDPGTPLALEARERGFRSVLTNPPDVGGRFSALALYGLAPAALIGVDVGELLVRARLAADACRRPPPTNFWLRLGRRLGDLAVAGRDKLTFVLSPRVESFGLWLEQLIAESTGKRGRGIVPVSGERPDDTEHYGGDRVFVRIGIVDDPMPEDDQDLTVLDQAGHPIVRTDLDDAYDLGAEFFGWEFATAVAGHVLGVQPFDQPDVAAAKRRTRAMLQGEAGETVSTGDNGDVRRLLDGTTRGDYLAVTLYAPASEARDRRLGRLQRVLRQRTGAAVTVAYGPRYLHSTGQLHKGGPSSVLVLQVVEPPEADLAVPGESWSFGHLIAAQADGDYHALRDAGRPVVRVTGWDALEEFLA